VRPAARVRFPMGQDERPPSSRRSRSEYDGAWDIIAYLLTGMLLWGGAGWLLDRWLGTRVFIMFGLLLGAGISTYLVYVRYGRPPQDPAAPDRDLHER
jgi:F0F1-type ATP synthase assembly protein I